MAGGLRSNSPLAMSNPDERARNEWLEEQLPRLRAFVRLQMSPLLRGRESVSDVVQSVCGEFLGQVDRLDDRNEHELRAWFYSAALNRVRQKLRYHMAQKRDVRAEAGRAASVSDDVLLECYASCLTPSRHAIANEEIGRIEKAFDELPQDYRDVIIFSRLLGMPHKEIGEKLGIGEGPARAKLSRALTRLSMVVQKLLGDEK